MEDVVNQIDGLNSHVLDEMDRWVDLLGGGQVGRYGVALIVLLVFFLLKRVLANGALVAMRRIAHQTKHGTVANVLDAISAPVQVLILLLGAYFATRILDLSGEFEAVLFEIFQFLATFSIFWALYRTIDPLSLTFNNLILRFGAGLGDDLRQFFLRGLKTLIVVVAGVVLLEDWGIDVSAFLGGLGLAGMAVALAAKDSVANIFGGFTIFADNLYKRGDWIETPALEGVVEIVGLRATKVRTFSKALVTMPNAQIVNEPVINWSRMTHRRIKMILGLEYRTTAQQLEKIVESLRVFLKEDKDVAQNGVAQMVHLSDFGASSINIDLYYFTLTTDWVQWRDIRNRHIIAFKRIVEDAGAAFAFPSQSIYVETMPEQSRTHATQQVDRVSKQEIG